MLLASQENFIIGCVYRHPQQDPHMFDKAFRDNICDLELHRNYAIFGDFNKDYANFNRNSKIEIMLTIY